MKIICAVLDNRDASHEEMSATDIKLFSILYGVFVEFIGNQQGRNNYGIFKTTSCYVSQIFFFFFSFESFICNHEEINENDILNDNLRSILDTGYWKYALSSFNRFS